MKGIATRIKYILGTLSTKAFWRYVITVFLDMFISMPLQSIITSVANGMIVGLRNTVPYMPFGLSTLLSFISTNF